MTTDKLINLALIRRKFIKDQLTEINNNIEKLANTGKTSLAIVCLTLL